MNLVTSKYLGWSSSAFCRGLLFSYGIVSSENRDTGAPWTFYRSIGPEELMSNPSETENLRSLNRAFTAFNNAKFLILAKFNL